MKRLLLILILTLSFQSLSKADDIRDFEIEGMSIGDSLLNYFSEDEIINNFNIYYYPGSRKYFRLWNNKNFNKSLIDYEEIAFEIKANDKKYKLEAINGTFNYKNNIDKCNLKQKKIINEISSSLNLPADENYTYKYPNNEGSSEVTDFNFSNGSIRIWCTDYSIKKEKNFVDHLGVAIQTKDHFKWVATKANK